VITVALMPKLSNEWTLGTWIVNGPFHPLWSQWVCSLVHLRGSVDGATARLQFPGATHEFVVIAQNPEHRLTIDSGPESLCLLRPVDVCQQLRATNDASAMARVEACLEYVRRGEISPDQDFRPVWRHLLAGEPPGVVEWAIK